MRWALTTATLLLAACIPSSDEGPRTPPSLPSQPDRATLQCHADLRNDAVEFRILPDRTFPGGCSAIGTVQLLDIGTPVTNLGAMTCPLARAFTRWTREAVQPAAQASFGSRVVRVESFGTYSCRPVNSQAGARLSEHGRSNAVDIAAFVLANGRRVTVLEGWRSGAEDTQRFLRAVHQAGCRRFGVVLGPDANALHYNHFHFDLGRSRYCR